MSLDRSYRRLLLAYPAVWWDERGEEVLGCLLDGAEARGAARPSYRESVNLIGHGLLVRVRRAVPHRPGSRELLATLSLASLTVLALLMFFVGEWWPWGPAFPIELSPAADLSTSLDIPGPFWTLGGPLALALLVPFLVAMAGRSRVTRPVLLTGAVLTVLTPVVAGLTGNNRPALWALGGLLTFTLLAATAPVRRRGVLAATTLGLVLVGAACVLVELNGYDPRTLFYYGPILTTFALIVPALVLIAVLVASVRGTLLAVSVIGLVWLMIAGVASNYGAGASVAAGAGVLTVNLVVVAARRARYAVSLRTGS